MDLQKYVRCLRVQLLCMSRVSQRALDYAVKGYQLVSPEFCRQVRTDEHKLGEHHRQVKYLCQRLTMEGVITASDFRFALTALRVNSALQRIYSAAAQMANDTMLILENCPIANHPPHLDGFGRAVNSLVRLCTVALFESEGSYAETVMQTQGIWRQCELIFDYSSNDLDRQMETQQGYTLAITQSLGVAAKQAHEIADAILFWLKDREDALDLVMGEYDALSFLSRDNIYRQIEYVTATAGGLLRDEFAAGSRNNFPGLQILK